MDRETFTLLRGKFGTERTHNCKYQPARVKLSLLSHTTYCMSTKIVPQYLYIHFKNCRRPTDIAVASFSQTQSSKGSRQTSEKIWGNAVFLDVFTCSGYQRQSRGNQAIAHLIQFLEIGPCHPRRQCRTIARHQRVFAGVSFPQRPFPPPLAPGSPTHPGNR